MADIEPVDPTWEQDWDAEPAKEPEIPTALVAEPVERESEQEEPEEHPEVKDPVTDAIREMAASQKQYADSVTQSVGSLADQLRQVNAEAALAKKVTTPDGPSQEAIAAATKDPESWAKLKEEWSEWATGIEDLLDHRIKAATPAAVDIEKLKADLSAEMRQQLDRERAEQRAQVESQKQFESARAKVIEAHSDFDETRVSPEFSAWKESQPPGVQALANSMDPADAIYMISLYKQSRPSPKTAAAVQANRVAKLNKAVVPSRSVASGPRQGVSFDGLNFEQAWELDSKLKASQARA